MRTLDVTESSDFEVLGMGIARCLGVRKIEGESLCGSPESNTDSMEDTRLIQCVIHRYYHNAYRRPNMVVGEGLSYPNYQCESFALDRDLMMSRRTHLSLSRYELSFIIYKADSSPAECFYPPMHVLTPKVSPNPSSQSHELTQS